VKVIWKSWVSGYVFREINSSAANYNRRIFDFIGCNSYDKIITAIHLQALKSYEYNLRQQQQSNKTKILLVDDEQDICLTYKTVLEEADYQCVAYTNPVTALQEFKRNYYDLIVLDAKMPQLNGYEFFKKIREQDNAIRMFFITAAKEYFDTLRREQYPEIGDIYIVSKPITNDYLIRIVDRFFSS
jgi:CheY-like chemotaxis protein